MSVSVITVDNLGDDFVVGTSKVNVSSERLKRMSGRAAIRALNADVPSVIFDRDTGLDYYRDDTDTTTADNVLTLVTANGKRMKAGVDFTRPEFYGKVIAGQDHSALIQAACNSGIQNVLFGSKEYRGMNIDAKNCNFIGSSNGRTILTAIGGTYMFKLGYDDPHWRYKVVQDILFKGGGRAYNIFEFGAAAYTEYSGRYEFVRCDFFECNKAIYKPHGDIGNYFRLCNFRANNFDYYAEGQTTPYMQAGFDTFDHCSHFSGKLANIYIDSPVGGTGGTRFIRPHFESNEGFNIFIKNYETAFTPVTIDGLWTEINATAPSVTINGVSYVPKNLHIENCPSFIVRDSVTELVKVVNSCGVFDNCLNSYGGTSVQVDAASNVKYTNLNNDGFLEKVLTVSLRRNVRKLSGQVGVLMAPHRQVKAVNKNAIWSESFSGGAVTFGGNIASVTGVVQNNSGPTFANSNRFTFIPGRQYFSPLFNLVAGKHYVFTICMKLLTDEIPNIYLAYDFTAAGGIGALLVKNKFITIAVTGESPTTGQVAFLVNTSSLAANCQMDMQAGQMMQFDTVQESIEYFNDRTF